MRCSPRTPGCYGDRGNYLAFVGLHLDVAALHRRLGGCLLTDAELAGGEDEWTSWPDPFAGCLDSEDDGTTYPPQ